MTKNVNHIQHVKSSVVVEGKPKLPQPSALVEGELAINYADGVETISIKNASSDIVTFSSDNYYTEQKLGSGFTGENSGITVTDALENLEVGSEVEISSGVTPTGETVDLWVDESVDPLTVDAYTKAEVNNLLDDKADTADTFTKTELSGSSANVVVKMSESATTASSADTAFSLYAESSITVDSGSSIVLEGEDGSPVKVKKDSFMSAVREALGSLIKNNDKGTSINGVAVTDANNDLGSITTANLASVLGVRSDFVPLITSSFNFNSTGEGDYIYSRLYNYAASDGTLPTPGFNTSWYTIVVIECHNIWLGGYQECTISHYENDSLRGRLKAYRQRSQTSNWSAWINM